MQNAPQGAFTVNFTYALDESSRHFAHIITQMKMHGYTKCDVKPEVEEEWLDEMWKVSPVSNGRTPGCTPGYYNNEGKVTPAGTKTLRGSYPAGKLFRAFEKERQEGTALNTYHLE